MNTLKNMGREEEAKKIELELIELFAKNENENSVGPIAYAIASRYAESGRYLLAVEYYLKSVDLFESIEDYDMVARANFDLAVAYENLNLNREAYESYSKAIANLRRVQDTLNLNNVHGALVFPAISIGKYDEARKYMSIALRDTLFRNKNFLFGRFNDANGQILKRQGKFLEAIPFFEKGMKEFNQASISWTAPFMPLYLTECYYKIGEFETALRYGLKCLELEKAYNLNNTLVKKRASLWLSKIYEELDDLGNAFAYLKIHQEITEESEKLDELNRIADAEVKEILDRSRKEIEVLEQEQFESIQKNRIQRLWIISITGALLSALVILLVLFRNNKNKQKANKLLLSQKEKIQDTLEKLEATQTQLIQSEKMASLGELTAGIAHEIQNPLNFVNNFSEINQELLLEVREGIASGNLEEVKDIIEDLTENEVKISEHGKRADSIVKGMLLHSRTATGEKTETDINALCDEYLRLAYHGLRAKDRNFNADFETQLDPSLPKIKVVPQDIGRVLLNLFNNAFCAASDEALHVRQIISEGQAKADSNFMAKLNVSTKLLDDKIQISISDNGPGIPEDIRDKIFQPFFTTKPTGEGTGLGLSLAYDIVKAHGGQLKLETDENEGSTFFIILPF
jgi:signal transduction histidine kinase